MKKTILIILLIIAVALLCEFHGFQRGFDSGQRATNSWWLDKKSRIYDTAEVLKKNAEHGYNQI